MSDAAKNFDILAPVWAFYMIILIVNKIIFLICI